MLWGIIFDLWSLSLLSIPSSFILSLTHTLSLSGKPRAASVIALDEGLLWALDRSIFREVVVRKANLRKEIFKALRRVELFKCLSLPQLQRLTDLLKDGTYARGDYIIRQGDLGEEFYVLVSGSCDCTINQPDGSEKLVFQPKLYDYFGEKALLSSNPRAANVIARSDVKVLYIGKNSFEEVLGPLAEMIEQDASSRKNLSLMEPNSRPLVFEDLSLYGVLCHDNVSSVILGSFGSGTLFNSAKPNISTHSYICSEVVKSNVMKSVLTEIDASRTITAHSVYCIFVPKMLSTIRYKNSYHLVYDTPIVANFNVLLKSQNVDLEISTNAYIYIAACLVSAMEYVHSVGIIYRAIQPETLFMDASGRIVFMDYRFAKVGDVAAKTYTVCGAADYLSPEQISQRGHSQEVDLWSLGVTLYELIVGEHPFTATNEVAVFSKISSLGKSSFPYLQFSLSIPVDLSSLVSQLIVPDSKQRLGHSGKLSELKKHKCFSSIDWKKIATPGYLSPLLDIAASEATLTADSTVDDELKEKWNSIGEGFSTEGDLWDL